MRIAIPIPCLDPSRGGAERYVLDLLRQLAQRGHQLHLFTGDAPRDLPSGVTLHRLQWSPRRGGRGTWAFALASARAIAGEGCEVVHSVGRTFHHNVYQPHGGSVLATIRRNLVASGTRWPRLRRVVQYGMSPRWQIYLGVERMATTRRRPPPLVVALSEMVRRDLIQDYGLPPDRIRIVPNGVDLDRFDPARTGPLRELVRTRLEVEADVPLLLLVANNFKLKGVAVAIQALADLHHSGRRAVLVVCGRGRGRAYRALARRLGVADAIRWVGSTPRMEDHYAAADVLVHPTFYDPCSLVLLEALASGLPTVTTRHNGASDLLPDCAREFILDEPEPAALAQRLQLLIDSGSRRREIASQGLAAIRRHGLAAHAAAMEAVYQEALDLGIAPAPAHS